LQKDGPTDCIVNLLGQRSFGPDLFGQPRRPTPERRTIGRTLDHDLTVDCTFEEAPEKRPGKLGGDHIGDHVAGHHRITNWKMDDADRRAMHHDDAIKPIDSLAEPHVRNRLCHLDVQTMSRADG
jgi:hypothetical protein